MDEFDVDEDDDMIFIYFVNGWDVFCFVLDTFLHWIFRKQMKTRHGGDVETHARMDRQSDRQRNRQREGKMDGRIVKQKVKTVIGMQSRKLTFFEFRKLKLFHF